jgi:hypothetical protein
MVDTERQAREVAKVPEEKRAQVIEIASTVAAAEERPMTARDIREAAEREPAKPADRVEQLRIRVKQALESALSAFAVADLPIVRSVMREALAESAERDARATMETAI